MRGLQQVAATQNSRAELSAERPSPSRSRRTQHSLDSLDRSLVILFRRSAESARFKRKHSATVQLLQGKLTKHTSANSTHDREPKPVYSPNSFLTRFKTESFDGSARGKRMSARLDGATKERRSGSTNRKGDPCSGSRVVQGKLARISPPVVGFDRQPV